MPNGERLLDERLLCRVHTAKQRALLLVEQIDRLSRSDFPHPDGQSALNEIRLRFEEHLARIEAATGLSERLLQSLAQTIHYEVELYLPVLGFILRSTNVRNAFELYDPLKHLVKQVVDQEAKLIISSEWDFVPFTYPMSLEALPNFVLVGGPAHESHHPFIIPLAGHEIGHTVWRYSEVGTELERVFAEELSSFIDSDTELKEELTEEYGPDYLGQILEFAAKRVEELYCDAFGYRLFGDAYAYAFERVLYPGMEIRDDRYPTIGQRLNLMRFMSNRWAGNLPEKFEEGWIVEGAGYYGDIDDIIDKASEATFEPIVKSVEETFRGAGVQQNAPKEIDEVYQTLRSGRPYQKSVSIGCLLNGAWLALREKYAGGAGDFEELLSEVTLKSLEVSQYLQLTGGGDAKS